MYYSKEYLGDQIHLLQKKDQSHVRELAAITITTKHTNNKTFITIIHLVNHISFFS